MSFATRAVALAATASALAAPAAAQASSDYVVTVSVPATSTCASVITEVTTDFAITPRTVYTSALCGFSASLSNSKARALSADSRVLSVREDGAVSGF